MDTQSYIDSGILELYAMDALSPEEMSEVERRAALDPVVAGEIREIREALAGLDRQGTRVPRAALRAMILDAIDRDAIDRDAIDRDAIDRDAVNRDAIGSDAIERDAIDSGAIGSDAIERDAVDGGAIGSDAIERDAIDRNVVAGRSGSRAVVLPARPVRRYGIAASWILAAIGAAAATYFGVQWRGAAAEAEMLRQENRRLAAVNSAIASRASGAEHAMVIMRSSEYHAVQLNGTEHAPAAHPVVYWNPHSHEVVLMVKNLPPPPAGKQYQLWAIHHGHRADAGVVDIARADSMQRLKDVDAAEAFAVTLERQGGSPVPDLTSIYAVGTL